MVFNVLEDFIMRVHSRLYFLIVESCEDELRTLWEVRGVCFQDCVKNKGCAVNKTKSMHEVSNNRDEEKKRKQKRTRTRIYNKKDMHCFLLHLLFLLSLSTYK